MTVSLPCEMVVCPFMARATRCKWCDSDIPATLGAGRTADYCSRSHRQLAYEARRLQLLLESEQGQKIIRAAVVRALKEEAA